MGFALEFRDKAGAYAAVPLADGTSARLRMQFEGPNRGVLFDDLNLELWDGDGAWAALLTAGNLSPADAYPSMYGFRVLRDGTPYWEGDLEYGSVEVDAERSRVTLRVLDAMKRCARKNAEALKRDYSALAIVEGPKESRVLEVSSLLDSSGYPLVPGDEITLGHYKPTWNSGSKLFQQTLVVESVDAAPAYSSTAAYRPGDAVSYGPPKYRCIKECTGVGPWNTTYWRAITAKVVTFKRKMQAHYQAGDVILVKDPWFRGLTAGTLVGMLLDLVPGFDAGHRSVSYAAAGGDDLVDVADFKGLTVTQALEKLAYWVNAVCYVRLGTFYFVGREVQEDPSPPVAIDALLASGPVRPADGDRYDLVVVKGRDKRYARKGLSPFGGKKLEEELPFSKDHARLQAVCDRLWAYWSPLRQGVPKAVLADDGTAWQLKQRVTAGGSEYFVTAASVPLNDGADVELELKASAGSAVPASAVDVDEEAEDEFDPPEPLNFVMTKTYSAAFNALYPASRYPRVSVRKELIGTDDGGGSLWANIPYRLYELRWEYPYDEVLSRVFRFELTIWADGKDREKPEVRLAVPPVLQPDGFYYAKRYLKARDHLNVAQIWWADVLARYDNLKEGIPSDADSSVAEGTLGNGDDAVPAAPTLYSLASYEQDAPGTKKVECDCLVGLTWTASALDAVEIQVQDGTLDTTRQMFAVNNPASGAETFTLKAKYRRGNTLTVKTRAKKGASAWGAWSSGGTVVAGANTGTAPVSASPAPTLLRTVRGKLKTKLKLQLGGTAADKKAVTHLEVYTAPKGTSSTPEPPDNAAWDTEPEQDVSIYTKRGKSTFWVIIHHRDLDDDGTVDKPAVALRACNNQSDQVGVWMYLDTLFDGWIQVEVDPLGTGDLATFRFTPVVTGGSGSGRKLRWNFGDGSGTDWETDVAGYYKDHTYSMRDEPLSMTVSMDAKDSSDNRFTVSTEIIAGGTATADTQPRKPATATSEANGFTGSTQWQNPGNVASASDTDYASVSLAAGAHSQDLKCVAYGMSAALVPGPGDAVPSSGVVRGLVAMVEVEASVADKVAWDKVQLVYNGVALGPSKVVITRLGLSKTTVLLGSYGDLWRSDLTCTKLRSSTFGILLGFQNTHNAAVLVKVYNLRLRAWGDSGI